jgi:hypothetical protein
MVGEEAFEQLVLGPLELGDLGHELGPVAGHCVGVLLGLAVLAIGHWDLGDHGSEAGFVCGVDKNRELFLDDAQLGAELSQPLGRL